MRPNGKLTIGGSATAMSIVPTAAGVAALGVGDIVWGFRFDPQLPQTRTLGVTFPAA